MGYWGLRGGSEMRHLFIMQAHSMKYKYMTSFALRDVIKARINKEDAEFVQHYLILKDGIIIELNFKNKKYF